MKVVDRMLPRSPESPGVARRLAHAHTGPFDEDRRDDVALMVSELVTNALQHGTGTISLRIDTENLAIRVEVSDEGNVAIAPTPNPGAHGGWGLRIVERLSDDWGALEGSTKVWFRLGEPR
jgi:anti-sigma regulatory factor (Ser/Thr protein kinase)